MGVPRCSERGDQPLGERGARHLSRVGGYRFGRRVTRQVGALIEPFRRHAPPSPPEPRATPACASGPALAAARRRTRRRSAARAPGGAPWPSASCSARCSAAGDLGGGELGVSRDPQALGAVLPRCDRYAVKPAKAPSEYYGDGHGSALPRASDLRHVTPRGCWARSAQEVRRRRSGSADVLALAASPGIRSRSISRRRARSACSSSRTRPSRRRGGACIHRTRGGRGRRGLARLSTRAGSPSSIRG